MTFGATEVFKWNYPTFRDTSYWLGPFARTTSTGPKGIIAILTGSDAVPTRHRGIWAFVSVMTTNATAAHTGDAPDPHAVYDLGCNGKTMLLDTTWPYDSFFDSGSPALFEDTPRTGLKWPTLWLQRSDSFRTYFMYQPEGVSEWVPVKAFTWSWSGKAERRPNGKYIISKSPAPSPATVESPTLQDTTSHPDWTANVKDCKDDWIKRP